MSEIFYRLLSQANGSLFLHEKDERFALVDSIVNTFLENDQRENIELKILRKTREIMNEYQRLDLSHPIISSTIPTRRALAVKCLNVKIDVFSFIGNKVKYIEYKAISNDEFSELIKSEITQFFYIALHVSECRGKLMEFQLVHRA